MPAITIKNIPDDLYNRLREAADMHHRSINGELLHCLEVMLKPRRLPVEVRLERIRQLRPAAGESAITPEEIAEAIERGRA